MLGCHLLVASLLVFCPKVVGAGRAIAIDFGEENTRIATVWDDIVVVIAKKIPNHITFTKGEGDSLEGDISPDNEYLLENLDRTIFGIRHLLDKDYRNLTEVEKESGIYIEMDRQLFVQIDGMLLTPVEVVAAFLREVRKVAEDYLEEQVSHAYIAIPAVFTDNERKNLVDAAKLAGFDSVHTPLEPVMAAHLLVNELQKDPVRIMILDLGSHFDVSILELDPPGLPKVLASTRRPGGAEMHRRLVEYVLKRRRSEGLPEIPSRPAMTALEQATMEAIEYLAFYEYQILNYTYMDEQHVIWRKDFFKMNDDLLRALDIQIEETMEMAGIRKLYLDDVRLIGSCAMSLGIRRRIENIFPHLFGRDPTPLKIFALVNNAVLTGTALHVHEVQDQKKPFIFTEGNVLPIGFSANHGPLQVIADLGRKKEATVMVTTSTPEQEAAALRIYSGNDELEETFVGEVTLSGLQSQPAGKLQIEVQFTVTARTLRVSMQEVGSDNKVEVTFDDQPRTLGIHPISPTKEEFTEMKQKRAEKNDLEAVVLVHSLEVHGSSDTDHAEL